MENRNLDARTTMSEGIDDYFERGMRSGKLYAAIYTPRITAGMRHLSFKENVLTKFDSKEAMEEHIRRNTQEAAEYEYISYTPLKVSVKVEVQ